MGASQSYTPRQLDLKRKLENLHDPATNPGCLISNKQIKSLKASVSKEELKAHEKMLMELGVTNDMQTGATRALSDAQPIRPSADYVNPPIDIVSHLTAAYSLFTPDRKNLTADVPNCFPCPMIFQYVLKESLVHELFACLCFLSPRSCKRMFIDSFAACLMDLIASEGHHVNQIDINRLRCDKTLLFLCLCISACRDDIIYWHFLEDESEIDIYYRAKVLIYYALACGRSTLACRLSLAFFGANLYSDPSSVCKRLVLCHQSEVCRRLELPSAPNKTKLSRIEQSKLDLTLASDVQKSALHGVFLSMWAGEQVAVFAEKLSNFDLTHDSVRLALLIRWMHAFLSVLVHPEKGRPAFCISSKDCDYINTRPSEFSIEDIMAKVRAERKDAKNNASQDLSPEVKWSPPSPDLKCYEDAHFEFELALAAMDRMIDAVEAETKSGPDTSASTTRESLITSEQSSSPSEQKVPMPKKQTCASGLTEDQTATVNRVWCELNQTALITRVSRIFEHLAEGDSSPSRVQRTIGLEQFAHESARVYAMQHADQLDIPMFQYERQSSEPIDLLDIRDFCVKRFSECSGQSIDLLNCVPETRHFSKLRFLDERGMKFNEFLAVFVFFMMRCPDLFKPAFKKLTPEQVFILQAVFGKRNVELLDWIVLEYGMQFTLTKVPRIYTLEHQALAMEELSQDVSLSDLYDLPNDT